MSAAGRSFWGWGSEEAQIGPEGLRGLATAVGGRLGIDPPKAVPAPTLEDVELPAPRVAPPEALAPICSAAPWERTRHTYGKSFRDVVRALARDFSPAPDVVAFPRNAAEVGAVLEWAGEAGVAAIPYGGGSSVVGGVEPAVGDGYAGTVSVDLGRLDRILEIDHMSRAARIEGGIYGPALEDGLRPHGLTLRHFPQSFEFSTLGGWIATRSGGHYAAGPTHVDEFVESLTVLAPSGSVETRRLPGSGAGPSPDRLFVGSEGILGIITEAWMRLQDRPVHRASVAVAFPDFLTGAEAARAVVQAGLAPTNCRLLDPTEATTAGAGDGTAAVLLLGFESAHHPVGGFLELAAECARDSGGTLGETRVTGPGDEPAGRGGSAGAWRGLFLQGPYLRDALARLGLVTETFETAITWDRFARFHGAVTEAVTAAVRDVCGAGWVACRFTHVYPDGCAPYYTIVAASSPADQLAHWAEIKAAASEAVLAHGATITHHHSVGRDHRPWYDRQRPAPYAEALRAAKRSLDPAGILNPGVLLDP